MSAANTDANKCPTCHRPKCSMCLIRPTPEDELANKRLCHGNCQACIDPKLICANPQHAAPPKRITSDELLAAIPPPPAAEPQFPVTTSTGISWTGPLHEVRAAEPQTTGLTRYDIVMRLKATSNPWNDYEYADMDKKDDGNWVRYADHAAAIAAKDAEIARLRQKLKEARDDRDDTSVELMEGFER